MSRFLFTFFTLIILTQAHPMFGPNMRLNTNDAENAIYSVLGQMDDFGSNPFEMYTFDKRGNI